jgi:signal transduction histidine kinase
MTSTSPAAALVDGTPIAGTPPHESAVTRSFEANGRHWAVALAPQARSESSQLLPWLILAVATILAAVAALATSRVLQGQSLVRERAEQRVRVLTAAAEERGRLARDLHDSVSQALFSMTLQARAAQLGAQQQGIDPDGPVGRALRELGELTRGALAEIRALIFELRPQALDEEGFVVALQQHAAALAARERVVVEVTGPAHRVSLDLRAEEQLFRVALEAVHNAVRHAEARRITVNVSMPDPAHVRVTISDDGRGFDPWNHVPGHFGLETMRERVEQIHGTLEITSRRGEGTTVAVDVPLTR